MKLIKLSVNLLLVLPICVLMIPFMLQWVFEETRKYDKGLWLWELT